MINMQWYIPASEAYSGGGALSKFEKAGIKGGKGKIGQNVKHLKILK